jgi:hypothetical protein
MSRSSAFDSLCQALYASLVLIHDLLELRDFFGDGKRLACQCIVLQAGLAQGRGECLVRLVVSQALGLTREFGLLRGNGQGGQGLSGLPGAQIDQSVLARSRPARVTRPLQEGKMAHSVARGPGKSQAQDKQHEQA